MTNLPKSASPSEPRTLAQEFLKSVEALLDWMNGNDLSADHAESCPEDYERLDDLLPKFRASIAAEPRRDELQHFIDRWTNPEDLLGKAGMTVLIKLLLKERAARASAAPLKQTRAALMEKALLKVSTTQFKWSGTTQNQWYYENKERLAELLVDFAERASLPQPSAGQTEGK